MCHLVTDGICVWELGCSAKRSYFCHVMQRYCFDKLSEFSKRSKKNTAGRCLWYLLLGERAEFLSIVFEVFAFTFILHLTLNSKLNFAVNCNAKLHIQTLRPMGWIVLFIHFLTSPLPWNVTIIICLQDLQDVNEQRLLWTHTRRATEGYIACFFSCTSQRFIWTIFMHVPCINFIWRKTIYWDSMFEFYRTLVLHKHWP